ncbi:polyprenol monophosphomannose synthase [Allokutzneria sp. A3M-2-11 16]|uniref:polyprenol monophosphomannose synthase n=1 Tax=Allokutzneria sp. A3M-2-11 16 TaxID=2962043 RepID=UPI0020B88B8D|nr:polyprenol monophosphomannose synthase [Allokutzneria sp. A3M-2-11 16]MCP3804680.1 polyprenol monophosphomannose synthase [Allokutzneria sp. A3M-2-11 16]
MSDQRDSVDGDLGRVLVVIPTYNERENIGPIIERLHKALPETHALVVDDGSPDGTGELVDKIAAEDERVHVMHRTEKAGLGAAYIAGFGWGLERDYGVIVEMDADGSHAPEDLPRLLEALADADLVIGSRYVPGGKVVNWPKRRWVLSKVANTYAKVALGARINDITAGFRAYRREALEKITQTDVESLGYCFQIDLAWRTVLAGFRVSEVPITFVEREIGVSKMGGGIIGEALFRVAQWGIKQRASQVRRLFTRS